MIAEVDPAEEFTHRYTGYCSGVARASASCLAMSGVLTVDESPTGVLLCRQYRQNAELLRCLIIFRSN